MPYDDYFNMSYNAIEAYENGEKPTSAWTKNVIIDTICDSVDRQHLDINTELLDDIPKKVLFDVFFTERSKHHVGCTYRFVPFFALDEACLATFDDTKLKALGKKNRKTKHSRYKQLPRFVEARYPVYDREGNVERQRVARGYIFKEWFTGCNGERKNINSRGFEVLKVIDGD